MPSELAYLFVELALLLTILGFCHGAFEWCELLSRRIGGRLLLLFVLWLVVDLVAVRLGLWAFPQGGTLSFRFLGLPLEEYILFWLHTLLTFMLVRLFEAREPTP